MKNLIPKRRFEEFKNSDPWEQRKAVDIADYSKGNGYSKSDLTENGTPIILYGRLYTKYQFAIDEVDTFATPKDGSIYSQGNEVIIPASGETAEDIARASAVEKSGILLGGDLNILRPFNFINPLFLALTISNGEPQKELAKKAQGKSVVHIHNSDIQEVTVSFPTRAEQDRIVAVFRSLDNLITLHQRKLDKLKETKLAYLSEMFPKEGELYPKRRFAGFTDPWEQRKLGDLLQTLPFKQFLKEPEPDGKYEIIQQGNEPVIGFANGTPCGDYKDVVIFGDHTLSLYKPQHPFFVATDGVRIVKGQQDTDGYYLLSLLERYKPQSEGYKRYYCILADTNCITTYNTSEQGQIGAFFKHLDNFITLHQRKLDKLKETKLAYLSEMFPKEGELYPKRRFAGFTDPWEQCKLGEVAQITMGQSPNSENYTDNPNDHILVQGNADMKNGRVSPRVWTTQVTKQAEKNDLILSVRAPVGDVGKTDYDVVLGRGVAGIKGNEFIFQLLTRMKENGYWRNLSTGSTFESINSNDIKEAYVLIPNNEEQVKIGLFFSNLDYLITLHQRKLDKLQALKQAYLSEMFV